MKGDNKNEHWLEEDPERVEFTTSREGEAGNMDVVEVGESRSEDDEEFKLEIKRKRMLGRQHVSEGTVGMDSVHSTPRKAKTGKNQQFRKDRQSPRSAINMYRTINVFDDEGSVSCEEQEALMGTEDLSTVQDRSSSSEEESVCTAVKLMHQAPQKMLLVGYGEEAASVGNWEFPCTWDNHNLVQGHLFVCRKSVVFVGDNFGKMAETQIQYVDIVKINKGMSNLFVPNAIIFKSVDSTHIFRHFWERDKCFERIMEGKAIYEKQQIGSEMGSGVERGDSFTSEDPTAHESLVPPHSCTTNIALKKAVLSGGNGHDQYLVCKSAPTSPVVPRLRMKGAAFMSSSKTNISEKKKMMRGVSSLRQVVLKRNDDHHEPDSHLKWNDADQNEAQMNRKLIEEMVDTCDGSGNYYDVVTAELPVSLEDFYRSFICDDAPYSLVMFHFARGDWEVDPTTWRADVEDFDIDGGPINGDKEAIKRALYRVIRFKTPLSVQFISCPSQVRTAKRQRLFVFGGAGIVYDTVTSVEDRIIMSDNFHVEDRWVVQPSGESNERCVVSVKYRVVWKKFTVLKAIIESKVRSDVTSFNTAFVDGMREYLTGAHVGSALQRRTSERAKPSTITFNQTVKSILCLPQTMQLILALHPKRFLASVGPVTMVLTALCMMYFAGFWLHFQLLNTGPFTFFVPSTCQGSLTFDSTTSSLLPSLRQFDPMYIKLGEAQVALRVALHQQVELQDTISAISNEPVCDTQVISAAIISLKDVKEALLRMENIVGDIYDELASVTSVR